MTAREGLKEAAEILAESEDGSRQSGGETPIRDRTAGQAQG